MWCASSFVRLTASSSRRRRMAAVAVPLREPTDEPPSRGSCRLDRWGHNTPTLQHTHCSLHNLGHILLHPTPNCCHRSKGQAPKLQKSLDRSTERTLTLARQSKRESHRTQREKFSFGRLLLRKMAKNSQTPLVSFEDLRPYLKLLGKNWWMLLGFAIVGYGSGRLVTHRMVDIHKATSELLVNQKENTGVDAMLGGRSVANAATTTTKFKTNFVSLVPTTSLAVPSTK